MINYQVKWASNARHKMRLLLQNASFNLAPFIASQHQRIVTLHNKAESLTES
jgi:hypothetical protein